MAKSSWCGEGAYEAAQEMLRHCLAADGSLFTPGVEIWTAANAKAVAERLNRIDASKGVKFPEKLRNQLIGLKPGALQLAAELLFIQQLSEADTTASTKLANVSGPLELIDAPPEIPQLVHNALESGIGVARFGQSRQRRDAYLRLHSDFLAEWKSLPREEQVQRSRDPDRFAEIVARVRHSGNAMGANAFLHLAFPDRFDSVISESHRGQIIAAFEQMPGVGDEDDVDRKLFLVRERLGTLLPREEDLYVAPIRRVWEQPTPPAWQQALELAPEIVKGAWTEDDGVPRSQLLGIPSNPVEPKKLAAVARTALGDDDLDGLAVELEARMLAAGLISRQGEVDASQALRILLLADPPAGWSDERRRQLAEFRAGSREADSEANTDPAPAPVDSAAAATPAAGTRPAPVALPPIAAELAERLNLPLKWLEEIAEMLASKRQLIFHGPPGAGKTYVARALAEHLTAQGGEARIVQFHPSYTYEDFFEGFRPLAASDGTMRFMLVPGPLRELADLAAADPGNPHILLIDEINRGNIAKIFGELYFALEYRDSPITLQYSRERPFQLPANLLIIGTMNTADRSIALVDTALRRRFYFVDFDPRRPPVKDVLSGWLTSHGHDTEPAELLELLNAEVDDEEFAIGPSYLIDPAGAAPDLERVWRHAILPLLAERHHGGEVDVEAEYGLERLRRLRLNNVTVELDGDAGDDANLAD